MTENIDKTAEAIEKTFGKRPEKIEKIEEGLIHETFDVEVDGENFILQFSGKDDEKHSALGQCLEMYELLRDTVPVPETVTEKVREIYGQEYIIVEKIEGKSGEKNISPEKTREAGKALAKIHNFTEFEREGWMKFDDPKNIEVFDFRERTLKRKQLSELEEKIETFRDEGLEEIAEKLEKFMKSYGKLFPEKFEAVIVHDDFTPDNIIYQDEEISGILDFDYAYSGLDIRDLVKSANGFWMHDPGADRDIRKNFYEGYKEVRTLHENFERLEKFFRVETLTHTIAGMIDLDELNEEELDFYREKILEELEASKEFLT